MDPTYYRSNEDAKRQLFALDKHSNVYGNANIKQMKAKQKDYFSRIKNLSQGQRQLVLEILTNPNPQITQSQLYNLRFALERKKGEMLTYYIGGAQDRKEVRSKRAGGPHLKVMRALKNTFGHRIDASTVITQINSSRISEETSIENLNSKLLAPNRELGFNEKLKLLTHSSLPLDIQAFKKFLNLHAKQFANFAFSHPRKWNHFYEKMQSKLLLLKPTERKEIWDLLISLNRLRINHSIDLEKSLPSELILKMIPMLSPRNLEGSLLAIKLLSGSSNPRLIAEFIMHHKISLTSIPLAHKQLKQVAAALGENLNLNDIGIFIHETNAKTKKPIHITVNQHFSYENLKYLRLFKNVEILELKTIKIDSILKFFPKLRALDYRGSVSNKDLYSLGSLPNLKKLAFTSFPSSSLIGFSVTGIKFLQNITDLTISGNDFDFGTSLGELNKVESLSLLFDKLSLSKLPPNLKSLGLSKLHNFSPSLKFKRLHLIACQNFSSNSPLLLNCRELDLQLYSLTPPEFNSPLPKLKILHNQHFLKATDINFLSNLRQFHFTGEDFNDNKNLITNNNLEILIKLPKLEVVCFKYETPSDDQLNLLKKSNLKKIIFPGEQLTLIFKNNEKVWI